MEDFNNKVISLLGMKNSGLDLLKKSLISSNVYFGKDGGNRESEFLKEFAETILSANGGSWHSPPHKVKINHYQQQLRDLFLAYFEDQDCWGFANASTILMMNVWDFPKHNIQPIGIFRHPNQLVAIYKSEYNFPAKLTYELWVKYNKKMLAKYDEAPFPIIGLNNKEAWFHKSVVKAFDQIGLHKKPQRLELSAASKFQFEEREMPKEVNRLYKKLDKLKVKP